MAPEFLGKHLFSLALEWVIASIGVSYRVY
jgi:hypothetical protein